MNIIKLPLMLLNERLREFERFRQAQRHVIFYVFYKNAKILYGAGYQTPALLGIPLFGTVICRL